MTKHNVGIKVATYYCRHKRAKLTKCSFSVSFKIIDGAVDINNPHDIRKGRRKEVERDEVTIPQIPIGYYRFKG